MKILPPGITPLSPLHFDYRCYHTFLIPFFTILLLTIILLNTGYVKAGEIHKAVREGNIGKVREIIRKNPQSVNERNREIEHGTAETTYAWMPLHFAVKGKVEIAELLIVNGADVNAVDGYGHMPLHFAATNPTKEMPELLVSKGADIHSRSNEGSTPLFMTAQWGKKEVAWYIISMGGKVDNVDNYGRTPLHRAAEKGNLEVAKVLIDAGANVRAEDNYKETPLHEASYSGSLEIVNLLIEKGADINAVSISGWTPLHNAATNQTNRDIIRILVSKGADPDAMSCKAQTPLDIALENSFYHHRDMETAKTLLSCGSQVYIQKLQEYARNNDWQIVRLILLYCWKLQVQALIIIISFAILGNILFRSRNKVNKDV